MRIGLVVLQPFGDYKRGDAIEEPEKVQAALEHNEHHVIKVDLDAREQASKPKE